MIKETENQVIDKLGKKINDLRFLRENFRPLDIKLNISSIANGLTAKDILDSRFEKEFLPLLYNSNNEVDGFLEFSINHLTNNSGIKNATKDEIKQIVKKAVLIEFGKDVQPSYYMTYSYNSLQKEYKDFFILALLETNLLNKFMEQRPNDIDTFFDSVFSEGEKAVVEKLYSTISKNNKINYTKFPIVVLNKNLESEDKIEIIKANYRQKDLISYMKIFSSELSDAADLDAFIEATVLRNTRVREKHKGVQNVIRRVFVIDTNYRFDFENVKGLSKFFRKYRKYFTEDLDNFKINFSRARSFYKNLNIEHLLGEMFRDASFDDKLTVADINKGAGERLMTLKQNSGFPEDVKGNKELERKFLLVSKKLIGHNVFEGLPGSELARVINNYPELLKEMDIGIDIAFYRRNNEEGEKYRKELFFNLKKETLEHSKFSLSSNDDHLTFFLKESERYYYSFNVTSKIRKYGDLLTMLDNILSDKDCPQHLKDSIFKTYFENLLDSDFVQGEILKTISNVFGKGDMIDEIGRRTNISNKYDVLPELIFNKILDLIKKHYPEYLKAIDGNIDRLNSTIRLILVL